MGAYEILCLIEEEMHEYFFDVQMHVLIHLIDEIDLASVGNTWLDILCRKIYVCAQSIWMLKSKDGMVNGKTFI